jgi:hypothetical protein
VYGALVTDDPTAAPSTKSLAENGPAPPVTVAATGTVVRAKDQSRGNVTVTPGGVPPTLNVTPADVLVLPAPSRAMLVSVCAPFASVEMSCGRRVS